MIYLLEQMLGQDQIFHFMHWQCLKCLEKVQKNQLETIDELKKKGNPLAFVGDVVGTGSSRKSATNSVLWHMGDEIPCIPNKKEGGFCFGGKIAPIFFNTLEDSGAFSC